MYICVCVCVVIYIYIYCFSFCFVKTPQSDDFISHYKGLLLHGSKLIVEKSKANSLKQGSNYGPGQTHNGRKYFSLVETYIHEVYFLKCRLLKPILMKCTVMKHTLKKHNLFAVVSNTVWLNFRISFI